MIDLVEELKEHNIVYVWLPSPKGFFYAEYKVSKSEYNGIQQHLAQLSLLKVVKKPRFFNTVIKVQGFRLEDNKTLKRPYKFYDEMDDMIKDFCRFIKNHSEENQKLFKKIKNRYPDFF